MFLGKGLLRRGYLFLGKGLLRGDSRQRQAFPSATACLLCLVRGVATQPVSAEWVTSRLSGGLLGSSSELGGTSFGARGYFSDALLRFTLEIHIAPVNVTSFGYLPVCDETTRFGLRTALV